MSEVREQVIAMLEEGKRYSETAEAFGLPYNEVYAIAKKAGIKERRTRERYEARAEKERQRAQRAKADRQQLAEALDRLKRGDLLPQTIETHNQLAAMVCWAVHGNPNSVEVTWEFDATAPLNPSEKSAVEWVVGIALLQVGDDEPLTGPDVRVVEHGVRPR